MAETKTQRASDQKLRRARARGDAPISRALCAAAGWGGFCVVAAWSAPAMLATWQTELRRALELGAALASGKPHLALQTYAADIAARALAPCLLPLLAAAASAALAGLAQSAGLFSIGALGPQESSSGLAARVRALVSLERGWDWLTSTVSLTLLLLVAWLTCRSSIAGVLAIAGLPPLRAAQALGSLLETLAVRVSLVALVLGLADAVLRRVRYYQRQRMTRREVVEEQREQYGDPHIRAERRRYLRRRGAGV